MTTVELLLVAGLVGLAFWQRSTFLQMLCGVLAICFGVFWIDDGTTWLHLIEGMTAVGVGLYMIIMVAVDLFKR